MSVGLLGLAVVVALLSYAGTHQLASTKSRLALLDHPNERSLHATPTHRTGGLAILGSVAAGLFLERISAWGGFPLGNTTQWTRVEEWWWIMGLATVLGMISFWDDRVGLPPFIRLSFHGLAALGVVYGAGLIVTAVSLPLLGTFSLGWMAGPLTVLGLMWMTNLYNFMDGMDGFAGGMTVIGFGVLSYLASIFASHELAIVSLLVAAAAAGFLLLNWPPARIFMGDVGSVPLGFLAGGLAVTGVHHAVYDVWVPILIFSPFVVDATITLLRRALNHAKVWQAHREHYYQRLVLAGLGHRKTVVGEYVLMLVSGIMAVRYVQAPEFVRLVILAALGMTYFGLGCIVHRIELSVCSGKTEG